MEQLAYRELSLTIAKAIQDATEVCDGGIRRMVDLFCMWGQLLQC